MPKRWCRSIRRSCPIRQTNLGLVSFRLCHGLLDFSAAVRALVDEVDLRPCSNGVRRLLRTQEVLGSCDKRLKLTRYRGAGRRLAYQVSLAGEAVTLPSTRRSLYRV